MGNNLYSESGSLLGSHDANFIYDLQGCFVGQLRGSQVYCMAGHYVGELEDGVIHDKRRDHGSVCLRQGNSKAPLGTSHQRGPFRAL